MRDLSAVSVVANLAFGHPNFAKAGWPGGQNLPLISRAYKEGSNFGRPPLAWPSASLPVGFGRGSGALRLDGAYRPSLMDSRIPARADGGRPARAGRGTAPSATRVQFLEKQA